MNTDLPPTSPDHPVPSPAAGSLLVESADPPLDPEDAYALLRLAAWMEQDGWWMVGHGVDGDQLVVTWTNDQREVRIPLSEMRRVVDAEDPAAAIGAFSVSEGGLP